MINLKINESKEEFNWSSFEGHNGGNRLIPNKSIKSEEKNAKCYSREIYAQELFNVYMNNRISFVKKDLNKGDNVKVTNIYNITDNSIDIELEGGVVVTIDLLREKRFIQLFGDYSVERFTEMLKEKDGVKMFLLNNVEAYVTESSPLKVSLWQGHVNMLKVEFMKQINEPTNAYVAKIVEANKGGFFVDIQGLTAFMPGSLAAPNKILDFFSYIGKEVTVMVEDFLPEINSFIVSHKKYLSYIIPSKIKELDTKTKYSGIVTGCSKYGAFIEFNEIFTGLLHSSKMNNETKRKFDENKIKVNDTIEFYIDEISKDNRIILTNEDPEEKLRKLNTFVIDNMGKILKAKIQAITSFGVMIGVDNMSSVIPMKYAKKMKSLSSLKPGDYIDVMAKEIQNESIVFEIK